MESLEKLSYDVYTATLSVRKKAELIKKLNDEIDKEYDKWLDVIAEFLDSNGLGVDGFGFRIHDKFESWALKGRGVLTLNNRKECVAFYINNGKLGQTNWDDMGSPHTKESIEFSKIESVYNGQIKKALLAFISSHPQLK